MPPEAPFWELNSYNVFGIKKRMIFNRDALYQYKATNNPHDAANIKVIFMEHPQEEILHAYVDQTLDSQEEETLRAHLSCCPQCSREVDELTLLFEELKHLPTSGPNRTLTTRILLAQQREKWDNRISFDLFSFLFGRVGWAAVAMGLLTGILLGISVSRTWLEPSLTMSIPSYEVADSEDLYLDYLISDNGDIL